MNIKQQQEFVLFVWNLLKLTARCFVYFQSSSSSYDSAIIGEAHGLITDMLADTTLPPHVVSGLRAVSNLLKPAESHSSMHKTRVSPLVSLTESTSYGSDSEENPYTGERPSSLPKVRTLLVRISFQYLQEITQI